MLIRKINITLHMVFYTEYKFLQAFIYPKA